MGSVGDIKVIPQVFYDLIARILPGTVAIWVFMAAGNRKAEEVIAALFDDATQLKSSTVVLVLTFLVMAYLLGHLITTISDFFLLKWVFTKPLQSFSKALDNTRKELCNSQLEERVSQLIEDTVGKADLVQHGDTEKPHKLIRLEPQVTAFYLWYDRARVLNPDVGSRLAKLRAEYHMRERIAQTLLIALLLHVLLCLLTRWKLPELAVAWNGYLISFCIGGFLIGRSAAIKACTTFQRSVINHYFLLNNISITDSKPELDALLISLEAFKKDPSLLLLDPDGKAKGRKILVTELDAQMEEKATEIEWKPLTNSGKCPVQIMRGTEMAIFTNHTSQDRHYHKKGTEIYTVLEGEMEIEVEQKHYSLSAGDVIVVNSEAFHQVKSSEKEFICQVISVNCHGEKDKYLE